MKSPWMSPNLNGVVLFVSILLLGVLVGVVFFSTTWIVDWQTGQIEKQNLPAGMIAVLIGLLLLIVLLLYVFSMRIGLMLPTKKKEAGGFVCYLFFGLVAVPVELFCARLAYHTLGEVTSDLYFMAVWLNLIFLVVAIRSPGFASILTFLLAGLILPYQLYLGDRLRRLQTEAGRIVAYAYEVRLKEQQFPPDLSGYKYEDETVEKFFSYNKSEDTFQLTWYVGTKSTSHWYNPKQGWCYYPD
ncbi:MAG: hypothetical protein JXA82_09395 [Sedimentisphaerales bacterium]|nr:hypothetical protein [Sedimentisphaerales bacterium]